MPARACVSTSSVKNTFVTASRWMSGCADVFIVTPLLSLQLDAIERVVLRHVGENHLVARLQALEHLNRADRCGTQLHLRGARLTGRAYLEDRDRAVFLSECRAADI